VAEVNLPLTPERVLEMVRRRGHDTMEMPEAAVGLPRCMAVCRCFQTAKLWPGPSPALARHLAVTSGHERLICVRRLTLGSRMMMQNIPDPHGARDC
jgi:hypothetical protein